MSEFLAYVVIGIFTGAAYAIAASGLVLTYSTTRVFNIAHGAVGMFFSFVFWDFSQNQGMPMWLSLILVLFVVAPAMGIAIQRFVTRGLGSAPVSISLVVTVALTVGLIGAATQIWKNDVPRAMPYFLPDMKPIEVGSIVLTGHQLVTILVSAVVAVLLWVLLTRTRVGTAMRASVDNPDLLQLYGGRPNLVASAAWAIGTSLGALGGIMLAPVIGLQYYDLTLLVISAYAAAMLGKLTNLPMTYLGAMGLGIAQSLTVGYLEDIPLVGGVTGLPAVIPVVFLFAILVLLPQAPLRIGQVKGIVSAPVPSFEKTGLWSGVLLVFVVLLAIGLSNPDQLKLGDALVYGILMLSLVLLTGYGGFVSLAQFTFAGVGAVVYAQLDQPNLFGLLVSIAVAAAVGAIVAIPVLRLTGLYLALATLAFAQFMEKTVFQASYAFEIGKQLDADKMGVLGMNFESSSSYNVLLAVFFVITAFAVVAVRRGRIGRILIASRDSQAACGTLGLDQRWFRVGLFAASAGLAGMAGALFASHRGTIVSNDFLYFNNLILLLMAVVWGVTSVTGALLGGVFMMYLPVAQSENPDLAGFLFILLAVGAVLLAKDPNGLANKIFGLSRLVQDRVFPALAERYPGMALSGADDPKKSTPVDLDDTSTIPAVTDELQDGEVDDVVATR